MVGTDEARARAVLVAMQDRVIRGPHAALGIELHATPADIRHAFLELTKTYHPARFGRMSTEIQRLSNEVFLSLRAAHDALAKPKVRTTGPILPSNTPTQRHPTGQLPTVARPPEPVAPTRPPTGPVAKVGAGRTTPPLGVRVTTAPSTNARTTPPLGVRITTPVPAPTKPAAPTRPPAAGAKVEDRELAPIHELMERGKWNEARAAITALSAKAPASTKYRALLSYTRGREAQLELRTDEARVELGAALQLDPDLQLAKTALAELFTRRK